MRWILGVLTLCLLGCAPTERFVKVSDQSIPKTVMIEVETVITDAVIVMTDDGFRIEEATIPVTVRGAGVFITETGHILTCAHLFEFDEIYAINTINYLDEVLDAELLFKDPYLDLALLKVYPSSSVAYARLADPRRLRVGQEVIAIGNPLRLNFTVTHGIISALYRDRNDCYNMTQSDTFVNPGNSGGPLLNLDGELVGINSRIVPPINATVFTGLGFSVNPGQIIEFLTRFRGLDKAIPKYGPSYWKKLFYGTNNL